MWVEQNQFGPAASTGSGSSNNLASCFTSAIVQLGQTLSAKQTCDQSGLGLGFQAVFPFFPATTGGLMNTRGAAAGVFTQGEPTLIISPTVIKETAERSRLVDLRLNEARGGEPADWLPDCVITFTGSEQLSLKPS